MSRLRRLWREWRAIARFRREHRRWRKSMARCGEPIRIPVDPKEV